MELRVGDKTGTITEKQPDPRCPVRPCFFSEIIFHLDIRVACQTEIGTGDPGEYGGFSDFSWSSDGGIGGTIC